MPSTALIIGATGSFGAHALVALQRHGSTIRALARDPAAAERKCGERMPVEWIAGDAMVADDVIVAAMGCEVIVHAANPPGYKNWRGLAMPMLEATIAAARTSGARIVLPGNVYNYAPDAGEAIGEDAPQAPITRKGKLRVEMEAMLRAASAEGVRTLVLRAGDFFGPAAPNSALMWLTSRKATQVTGVYDTGRCGHDFAYLPDLAETLARLLDRQAELADYDVFHFRGHWLEDGRALGEAIRKVTGDERIPIRAFPWWMIALASPFVGFLRELLEMRYLWSRPIGLDETKLAAFIDIPRTRFDCALRESLIELGVEPGARSWTAGRSQPYITVHAGQNAV
jgi:nucleoside-diphosphate-sugar epimerase